MKTINTLLAALVLLGTTTRLNAQETDPRWLPWVGCWQSVDEDRDAPDLLCVRPSGGGVQVSEIVGGTTRNSYTLAADGRAYALEVEGCTGSRTAEFSTDGHRIFTVNEESCGGETPRSSTGLIAMVSPDEWIDVQAAAEDGKGLGWARRYRPARAQQTADAGFADLADRASVARRARLAAAAAVDVDDVIEAVRRVDPEGVRTWIAELKDSFDLDKRQLVRMADAHVPSSVIDVMVAVSFPKRFALDRDGDIEELADRPPPGATRRGYRGRYRCGFFCPVYIDPFYGGYGPYYGGGYYGGYGYYGPGIVVVTPRRDPEPNAKVVKGRGYTRGNGGGSSGGKGGSSVRGPSSGGSRSEPSSGESSSGGSSSGSSEGRHAKPRGG